MIDSSLQLLNNYLKFQIKLNTPFPVYNVDQSSETNAFNAGVHYGLKKALEVLSSFRTAEELSDYLASFKDETNDNPF